MLRDVAERDLRTTVLGTEMSAPVLLAPIGVQTIVHADGELATARAAAATGTPMVVSTAAAHTLEAIAAEGGAGPRWYQLYWPNDHEIAASIVARAEAAGYEALVVTLDTFIPGWKPRDLQQAWLPFLEGVGNANFLEDPVFRTQLAPPARGGHGGRDGPLPGHLRQPLPEPGTTSPGCASGPRLPIVVKGVLHADDARRAREQGVDGVIVSNHGGRQVDGAIASIDALPAVVEAVAGELAILLDSGIRGGSDAIKAMALGAEAVLLGRPYLWGLALEGEAGSRRCSGCCSPSST